MGILVGRSCRRGLASIVLVASALAVPAAARDGSAAATVSAFAAASTAPGTYTGRGFDACTAPSSTAMQAWLASPYRAIGIYIGGVNRGCLQPNLTASWVSAQQAAGWHLMPLYVGRQAPCTTSSKQYLIDPAQAAALGKAEADDAANKASALGLGRDTIVINDMEAYEIGDAVCRSAVLTYIGAFNAQLHQRGYLSGFYSSMASGIADQVNAYNNAGYNRPDYIDFARWDLVATTSDPAIPSTYWAGHRRIKQYRGDHNEMYGGVTINIDNDYLDVAPLPTTAFGDFNENGWSDLITRQTTTARLYLHSGNGVSVASPRQIGSGWNGMSAIVRFGDFNRDGHEDILAREAGTGYLYLYRWTGTGFLSRLKVGSGWNGFREITAVGDMNRDGYPDLLAVQSATGVLYYYPHNGTGWGSRVQLGSGWNAMDELVGVGDANRDGYVDLYARQKSTGDLYFYAGRGGGFSPRVRIGVGWSGLRSLTGVGDFDRDGKTDLIAVQTSNGYAYLYPGNGSGGLSTRRFLGGGWSTMQPLL
jgi:hypothetical protein